MSVPAAIAAVTAHARISSTTFGNAVKDLLNFLRDKPLCVMYSTNAQSITSGTDTVITFSSEDTDGDGMHSTSSNTGRITPPTPGWYRFVGSFAFASDATGWRYGYLRKQATSRFGEMLVPAVNGVRTSLVCEAVIYCDGTNYVELLCAHNKGSALALDATAYISFSAEWIRASL